MADFDTDVLIVGAGPTGLTLAVELARRGVACRIVDKADAPAKESRALGIHARTMETFELMGVLPGFLEAGHKVHGVRAIAEGKEIVHVRLAEIDSRYPFVLVLPQSETERLLTKRLTSLGVPVERSTSLTTFVQDADGVTARLIRGDAQEEVRSRWIAGCDGAHSQVRHTLGLQFEGAPYDEQFMLADVRLKWEHGSEELVVYIAESGLAAFFPMGGNLWRVVISLNELVASGPSAAGGDENHGVQTSELSLDEIRALVAERVDAPVDITDPVWTARFRIHRRIVEMLSVGRAFLAGDAADIHSPAGGQGMNTGIQSAHNLAWKLALVNSGKAVESLLESYNAERHPIELDVLRDTDLLTRMITATGPFAHWVRDKLVPILSNLDFVQHRITANVSEVAIAYRRSPIVEEHPVPGSNLRAGDHAPDFRVFPVRGGVAGAEAKGGKGIADLVDPVKYILFVLSGPVIERPHVPSGDGDSAADVTGFGPLLPAFSGIGGATAFPAGGREPAEAGLPSDALYRVVTAGKAASERYDDVVRCHLIVRDDDQTYGFDWSCETWLDRDATLHERYGSSAPSLYLIRPDGYIAFRGGAADAENLLTYLGRVAGVRQPD